MKIRKILVFIFLFVGLISLVSCTNNGNPSGNKTPGNVTEENVIVSIEAKAEDEEGYLNCAYVPKNVTVYAVYKDGTKTNITNKSKYEVSTEKLGKATVTVTYETFTTTYSITVVENAAVNLVYQIAGAKTTYGIGEIFDESIISVYAYYLDGSKKEVSDFTVELYLNNKLVDDLSNEGIYEVRISTTVGTKDLTEKYFILVTDDAPNEKIYASLLLNESKVQKVFENENFNYNGLEVYGLTYGVTESGNELLDSKDYTVSLYYQNELVTDFDKNGTYQVVVRYIGEVKCLNPEANYSVSYVSTLPEVVVPSITIKGLDKADVVIPELGTVTTYNISLTHESESVSLDSLEISLTDLNPDVEYTISGSYVTTSDIVVNLRPLVFTTKVYENYQPIDEEEAILNVAGNSFEISVDQFKANAPTGFELGGFTIEKVETKEKMDLPYDPKESTLYVTDLENNQNYYIEAYYQRVTSSVKSLKRAAYDVTPGYNFHFVGFFVLTYGNVNYRVRIMYESRLLYTWYVEEGTYIHEPFAFVLPNDLIERHILGTEADLRDVHSDIDAEVLMSNSGEDGPYYVIYADEQSFYGYPHIVNVEEVEKGANGTVYTGTLPDYYDRDVYFYEFAGWQTKSLENVTNDIIVYSRFTRYILKEPVLTRCIMYVQAEYMEVDFRYESYGNKSSLTLYVIDSNGNRTDLDDSKKCDNLIPNMNYKLYYEIEYLALNGSGMEVITDFYEFRTVGLTESIPGANLEITDITFRSATVSSPVEVDRFAYFDPETHELYHGNASLNKKTNKYTHTFNSLMVDKPYEFFYMNKINTNYYQIYNVPYSCKTAYAAEPKFQRIVLFLESEKNEDPIIRFEIDSEYIMDIEFVEFRYQYLELLNIDEVFVSQLFYDEEKGYYYAYYKGMWALFERNYGDMTGTYEMQLREIHYIYHYNRTKDVYIWDIWSRKQQEVDGKKAYVINFENNEPISV